MDTVPPDFSWRVSSARRCCESAVKCWCECEIPFLESTSWTFTVLWERPVFECAICLIDGQWMHGFHKTHERDLHRHFSMEKLTRRKHLRSVRITTVHIIDRKEKHEFHDVLTPVEDMEKLLNLLTYISNEPQLVTEVNEFGRPEHSALLEWMEGMTFSAFYFRLYLPIFERLLRNHLPGREYPSIDECDDITGTIAHLLKSGHLKSFLSTSAHVFTVDVLEGIIQDFLAKPQESSSELRIAANFDHYSAKEMMQKMEKEGLCRAADSTPQYNWHYTFANQETTLNVISGVRLIKIRVGDDSS